MKKTTKAKLIYNAKAAALTLLILSGLGAYPLLYKKSWQITTISVTSKERIVEASGKSTSSKYLIFTKAEVFENTDSILFLKWGASDVQGALHKDKKYKVLVAGWRVPFLSMYRNIVEVIGPVDQGH